MICKKCSQPIQPMLTSTSCGCNDNNDIEQPSEMDVQCATIIEAVRMCTEAINALKKTIEDTFSYEPVGVNLVGEVTSTECGVTYETGIIKNDNRAV